MRILCGALLLGLCAWQTHHRAEAWRSDEALWRAAVQAAPFLAKPAFNLGATLLHEARWREAAEAFLAAAERSGRRDAFHRSAGVALGFIDTVGVPICDAPRFASACAWVSP